MWGWQSSRTVVVGLAIVVFAACCLLPIAYLLIITFVPGDTPPVQMLDLRQRGLLATTTLLGLGTALLSTVIGAPLGLVLARVAVPAKTLLRIALAAPVLLPPYIAGLAWTYFGSSQGWAATLVSPELLSEWTYSLPAAILVLSLVFYPLTMLATEVAARAVDGRLEEAALMVAPPGRVLRRVTIPLIVPAVGAAALLVFVLAISEFGVPALLRVRVYTTEVFTAFAALYDFGRAMVLTVPLLLLCVVVAAIAGAVLGDRLITTRRGARSAPALAAGWERVAMSSVLVVLTVALALPIALLGAEAVRGQSLSAVATGSGEAIANSLLLATAGATIAVTIALWLGYARARAERRVGRVVDVLWIVIFAVPSTIVGIGLIALWNRAGPLGVAYGTDAMLLLGYLARFVPIASLALAAGMRNISRSQEEAAAIGGAGWLRAMWRIVLPQIRPSLAATWVVVFVLAFGELGVSILVAPPGEATLPIRVYTIIANTPASHVATLALLQSAVIFVPLAAVGAAAALRERR